MTQPFTDAHVHFPTWSLAQRDVVLEGTASLAEALARVAAHPRPAGWIRGRGWRDALWAEHPTREALDAVTGDAPAALWAKDYHSLWVNSAALARPTAPPRPSQSAPRQSATLCT